MPYFLIADDSFIIMTGLKVVINNILSNCTIEEAWNAGSAFEKIKHHQYDLVLLNSSIGDTNSFELVTNILAIKTDMRIIIFSTNPEPLDAQRFLKMGVKGYLQKNEGPEEIKKAITMVLANKKYISPRLKQRFFNKGNNQRVSNPFDKLSSREFEVLQHLVRGESVSKISEKLALHPSTIGTHKARIFKKLDCDNVIELNSLAKAHRVFPQLKS